MKIYSYNINNASKAEIDEWCEAMSDERKADVARIKIEKKQKQKIIADRLCRLAISEFCEIPPENIIFKTTEKGKPFAAGLNIHFSVSHSGDYVVCAVSDKEIGIDIEKIRSANPRAAQKFASPKEIDYINSNQNGFFEIWTLKEAYFKCIGTGLGADIKNVTFDISGNQIECSENGYEFLFHNISEEYICSISQKL